MAKEKGRVNEFLEPCVFVEFENGKRVEFVIDTGFNGSLCLPRTLMMELELKKDLEEEIFGIGTHRETMDIAIGNIMWLDRKSAVDNLINDGDDRLLGSQMLDKKILRINYENGNLSIRDS